jgi:DNA-binding NarL/FixJ family response regulator
LERKKHCQDVHICLVGANRFQNDLFVSSMKNILHCQCRYTEIGSCQELAQVNWNKTVQKNLVYMDCFNLERDDVEKLLHSVNQNIPLGTLLALYNCPENATYEKRALALGVRGFFHPDDSPQKFCRGTRAVLNKELWISRKKLAEYFLDGIAKVSYHRPRECSGTAKLTPREKEILVLLVTGASNRDLADELHISVHTIRTHLYKIYQKIKVKNRTEASSWIQKNL